MKCNKCGESIEIQLGKSVNFCSNCGNKIESEKSNEWKYFDNTKELLAFIVAEYGIDALFSRKYLSDHSTPLMPIGQKNLVKQAYECGAVKILYSNINSDQAHKEIAVKQAVGRMIDNYGTAEEFAGDVIWAFTNAMGWGMPEPQTQVSKQIEGKIAECERKMQKATQKAAADNKKPGFPKSNTPVSMRVGDIVPFGKYDWRVLDVQGGKALLISNSVLKKRCYHATYEATTWETCTLRRYLNRDFIQTFGAAKSAIVKIHNKNPNNLWYGTSCGNATTDKVFLLSIEEVIKYFGDSGDYKNIRKKNGRSGEIDSSGIWLHDQYNDARAAKLDISGVYRYENSWWLRTLGGYNEYATFDCGNGVINVQGFSVTDELGIRPAMWVKLDATEVGRN